MSPNSNTIFIFYFILFSLKKWFNNQKLPHHSCEQSQTKLVHLDESFPKYSSMKHCGLRDFNVTKQNKPHCFIDRYHKVQDDGYGSGVNSIKKEGTQKGEKR
jgi:hypothetical protein